MAYQDPAGSRSGRTSGRTTRRSRDRITKSETVYNQSTNRVERYKGTAYVDVSGLQPKIAGANWRQIPRRAPSSGSSSGPNFSRGRYGAASRGPNYKRGRR